MTVRLDETDRNKIEQTIREQYPRLRNASDVIRAALRQFLSKEG